MAITLIQETGLKPLGANSYVTHTDADAYHAIQGNDVWIATTDTDLIKQCLILATQAVDLLYGARYQSCIYPDSTQALLFPRMWFMDANARIVKENTIPKCLKDAVCEVALMQLNGDDIFPLASTSNLVKLKKIKAGDIASDIEYFKAAEGESFAGFRKVDIILRPILKAPQEASWRLRA